MNSAKVLVLLALCILSTDVKAQVSPRRLPWQQQGPNNTAFDRADPFANVRVSPVNPDATPTGGVIPASQLHIPGKAVKEYERSQKAYNSGDLHSSTEHLQKALGIYPQFERAHNALGLRYVQLHEYAKAIDEHQAAIALNPNDSEAHADLSLDLLLLDRYQEAEGEARESLRLGPDAFGPRYVLGRALIAQRRITPEALRMLKESEAAFPNASLVLAQIDYSMGNADETIVHLRQYLKAAPDRDNQHKAECWLGRLTGQASSAICADVPVRPSFK